MSLLKVNEIQIFNGETVTITAPAVVTANDNTNAALRITQTGSGNALVVEDSANPDSTPFVVDANGRVILGDVDSLTYSASLSIIPPLQLNSTGSFPIGISRFSNNSGSPGLFFLKSRGESTGSFDLVAENDNLGTFLWLGSDGLDGIAAASIEAEVDGTPGTNDMPGRLVFSTTADGAASLTERMRINSSGNVGIGTTSPNSKLNVVTSSTDAAVTITQTGTGNALVVEDSANPDSTPFVVDASGNVVSGSETAVNYGGFIPRIQLNADGPAQFGISRFSNNANQNAFVFLKSRGTSVNDFSSVVENDGLGQITWYAADGTTGIQAAAINAYVDGTPGTDDMPGRLSFSTTADGASDPTERMRIDSSGNVGIGTTSPAQKLDVTGNINATGALTLGTALAVAEGGTGVTSLGSLDAGDLGSGAATDGYVLTADGAGGAAWEAASGGGGGTTAYVEHSSTISDSFTVTSGNNRMYIGGTTFSGTISVAGRLAIVAGPANFTGTINVTGTLATV